ncbi:phosphotransferase family protein [Xylona heveae TC161]|uniref:Phosphotransferase family protein n=1 Tax=Xylona heveae (strain CBS 132557 / TC161) TaxID=1328760 RepID=A0A165H5Z7_XYLHT|nr:phosphotransferase family protein [Xylona heveae TC161]KZF23034.1 phosphotransferase family protein [Xylona heveae TC161]
MSSAGVEHRFAELFHYTSGRWLWDEEKQKGDRFAAFNVPELQRVAAKSIGANECIAITKLAEGSFNKTFKLRMNNGTNVIARIPHPIAGPQYYTTASEVATMDFARSVLEIPTPKVYAWNADKNNPVGSEYIIMEEARGTQLDDIWNDLSLEERIVIMKDLVSIEKKMLSVSFNRYGSLYYATQNIPGAAMAEVVSDVPEEVKNTVMRRFAIGPVVERDYWNNERATMDIDRGPWKCAQDYVTSPARRELQWIKHYAVPKTPDDPLITSVTQNSPDSHLSLLQKYLEAAPFLLPDDPAIVAPHIWHTDLHSANIFVDQGHICSVIDWQGTWAAPLILCARHARLVDYQGEIILKAPANFNDLEPDEKNKIRRQMSSSIILYLYEKQIAKEAPLLNKALRFSHGRTRCDPIHFVGDTWDDDIFPLRESLIRVERYWDELGFDFPCPIHFTEDEVCAHAKDGEGWNDVQDFWSSVAGIVSRDGWTPNHLYNDAVALFQELREIGLKSLVDKERVEFKNQTEWIETHSRDHRV